MSVQNISGRRGGVISWVAALVLLLLIAGFDNQWTENWRSQRPLDSWQAQPVGLLGSLSWRATPFHGESARVYAAELAAAVIAVVITGLLSMLVCRGVGTERGRWPLFLGTWLVTCLAGVISLMAEVLIAGDDTLKLDVGTTYTTVADRGFGFGLYAGWLIGFAAVLVYGSTPGMDDYVTDSEYDTPSGYDYGSAVPSASYSYSPTSPYSHGNGGYGDYGGYSGGEETTQVTPPYDPYGGRDY